MKIESLFLDGVVTKRQRHILHQFLDRCPDVPAEWINRNMEDVAIAFRDHFSARPSGLGAVTIAQIAYLLREYGVANLFGVIEDVDGQGTKEIMKARVDSMHSSRQSDRHLLMLRSEGHSFPQIAKRTGLDPGVIARRITREKGRLRLEKALGRQPLKHAAPDAGIRGEMASEIVGTRVPSKGAAGLYP